MIFLRCNFKMSLFPPASKKCPASIRFSSESSAGKPPPLNLKKVRTNTKSSGTGQQTTQKQMSKATAVTFLAIPAITFGLGCWQVQRRSQKLDMIRYLQDRTKSIPAELPKDKNELADLVKNHEYRPFRVKGHFLHSKEVLLTVRHDLQGRVRLPGGYVITPFAVSDRPGLIILVNRGYVPYTKYSPSTRSEGQIENEVEIIGLLRGNELTSTFTPVNIPPNEWHFRDVGLLAESLGTAPIFIDAVDETTVRGGPLAGQTAINLRNEHMSYILTWYTLSVLTSFMWWRRFARVLF